MRVIDADELKKCVLKWLPQDPCGKEEKEMPLKMIERGTSNVGEN